MLAGIKAALGIGGVAAVAVAARAAALDHNAFKRVIALFESHSNYRALYGGGEFASFAEHPNKQVPFYNKAKQRWDYSTAAGAYQINFPTWMDYRRATNAAITFDPAAQEACADWLLTKCGAYAALDAGDLMLAIQRASTKWASLPGSTALQNPKTGEQFITAFIKNGGTLA